MIGRATLSDSIVKKIENASKKSTWLGLLFQYLYVLSEEDECVHRSEPLDVAKYLARYVIPRATRSESCRKKKRELLTKSIVVMTISKESWLGLEATRTDNNKDHRKRLLDV